MIEQVISLQTISWAFISAIVFLGCCIIFVYDPNRMPNPKKAKKPASKKPVAKKGLVNVKPREQAPDDKQLMREFQEYKKFKQQQASNQN